MKNKGASQTALARHEIRKAGAFLMNTCDGKTHASLNGFPRLSGIEMPSASLSTSSAVCTGTISSRCLVSSGTSSRSRMLSFGIRTFRTPARSAAMSFSGRPPIGSTCPRSDISPVIARYRLTGIPSARDVTAVNMVIPADGPSFGVAPSGMWM